MGLTGKGFFIWKIRDCEGGSPEGIADAAQSAGFTHVLLKVADGNYSYNVDTMTKNDLVPPVVEALRARGIAVWGWQYVYGYDPAGEARIAIRRIQQFNLDGFVIDAEAEYKVPGREACARKYASELRKALPNLPLALSSYRFPSYHMQLPWRAFLEYCDYNMPQVYWEQAHNPAPQLARCVREFQSLLPYRPVIPTGPAYKWNGWRPTEEDFQEFFSAVKDLKLDGVNFFSWDECRRDLPNLWDQFARLDWDGTTVVPKGLPEQYIEALNSYNLENIIKLYRPDAVHVSASQTIQGYDALRAWYQSLWAAVPQASFTLAGISGSGSSRHFNWKATSNKARINNGNDTFGILEGKIAYHYTNFTVQS